MFELTLIMLALPLSAFVVLLLGGKIIPPKKSPFVAITAMAISTVLAWALLIAVILGKEFERHFTWFDVGGQIVHLGVILDPLAAGMLLVVTMVALLVQIYSLGYMHGEKRMNWYYAALSLFTFAMLGVVVSSSLIQLLVFWELVGLCSYFLIGFWYEREDASRAAKKAFLTTRTGDVGFLVGAILFFTVLGTFHIPTLYERAASINPNLLAVMVLLLFAGAVGKSAQLPLHVWLPDAMAGPTPVSALIHAATMVAAGVYLVARTYPLFEMAPVALEVVAYVGAFTAFFAATIALVQVDIKKILAYSTVSQLGYMMVGLGVGSLATGMFHLTTHAAFKALLFLTAGSVIHSLHTQDIREMGRLYPKMKVTAITTIIGGLALAGVPPFAGFWSKDEILLEAAHNHFTLIYYLALITAGLTAFYIFRLIFLTFFGDEEVEAHESPPVMTVPLIVLAVVSIFIGFLNSPFLNNAFGHFLGEKEALKPDLSIMATSVFVAFAGIFVAYRSYYFQPGKKSRLNSLLSKRILAEKYWINQAYLRTFGFVADFLRHVAYNKYFVDEFYQLVIVRPVHYFADLLYLFDLKVIDGLVNSIGWATLSVAYSVGGFDVAVIDRAIDHFGKGALGVSKIMGGFDVEIDKISVSMGRGAVGVSKVMGGADSKADKATEGLGWTNLRLGWLARGFDLGVVDGAVNGVSLLIAGIGKRLRRIQSGYLQDYPLIMFLTVLTLIIVVIFLGKK
ncbi:MAG TPA: NADH-quinone oxidoreductase subunit L [Candidatus Subteraquimicrobiales bacterium]